MRVDGRGLRSCLPYGCLVTLVGSCQRSPEDGVIGIRQHDIHKVLTRKRAGYSGEEVTRPHRLTLAQIILGLPPQGTVGIVDPLPSHLTEFVRSSWVRPCPCVTSVSRLHVDLRVSTRVQEEWNATGNEVL